MAEEMKNAPEYKVRYSDEELQEFKAIIRNLLLPLNTHNDFYAMNEFRIHQATFS